jgi:drug/metabolite transporter (DMT)-like permease
MVLILYLVMCLIFGTTFLFIKVGLTLGWSPMLFASLRFLIAGILVLFLMYVMKREIPSSWKVHREYMMVAFVMTTIPFAALYQSEQYISSGMASILVATAPIFIVLMNRFLNKNKLIVSQVLGVILCMTGIVMIVLPDINLKGGYTDFVVKGCLLLAEIAFAYGTIQSKRMLRDVNPFVFNGLQMCYGGLFLFLIAIVSQEKLTIPFNWTAISLLVYFIVVASIISNGIYYWLMKKTNPLFPSTWTYIAPLIAMFVGWTVLEERFSLHGMWGAGLVIVGIIFTNADLLQVLVRKKKFSPNKEKYS